MTINQKADIPAGWIGGFAESDPAFAYPNPNLTSLPMLDNMANICRLERQQSAKWPEFSWESVPGDPTSRCFQMFAPDISRLGYTDTGRVYSIICPQQGVCSPLLGCLNVEVSVTRQRGWANETNQTLAADMTVEGKIWFSPSATQSSMVKFLWTRFATCGLPFPSNKANAIRITTHKNKTPTQPIFPVLTGETNLFASPEFARHPAEAWAVANVEVEIGPIVPIGNPVVDGFNQLVVDTFNVVAGNILQSGNLLSWNIWFEAPQIVNRTEWRDHAEKWRQSIDADHGSPCGNGTSAKYFDGSLFRPVEALIEEEADRIWAYLKAHF